MPDPIPRDALPPGTELTPDGYWMCKDCGHNTSAAIAGRCTVFVPCAPGDSVMARYCDCDCYKARYGMSLFEKTFGAPSAGEG